MTNPSSEALAGLFPQASRQQWRELVSGVLARSAAQSGAAGSADPERLLASTTYDGITLAPLYTAADADGTPPAGFPGLPPFVRGGRPEGGAVTGWDVRQRHALPDPVAAADAVRADLEHGATSVWLVLGPAGLPVDALARVLDGVSAPVTLDAGADYRAAADALLALRSAQGMPASEITGNLGADPLGFAARTGGRPDTGGVAELAAEVVAGSPLLRTVMVDALPYHEAGGSDAEELGCSLAAGVAYLRALTGAELSAGTAAAALEFRYAATADQFLTIAKFRAARRLWARVTELCGVTARPAAAQRQHAVTSPAMMARRDPWVNMLRTTVACFAAGVGGADAITVLPFDDALGLPVTFSARIARNTQSILLEESTVASVIDPAGGSWYVERLTDELAHAAWSWFTEIERAGGFAAALESGLIAERLTATWRSRSDNLASGVDGIIGVTEFPNGEERQLDRQPAPAAPSGGLPRIRYAEAFES